MMRSTRAVRIGTTFCKLRMVMIMRRSGQVSNNGNRKTRIFKNIYFTKREGKRGKREVLGDENHTNRSLWSGHLLFLAQREEEDDNASDEEHHSKDEENERDDPTEEEDNQKENKAHESKSQMRNGSRF